MALMKPKGLTENDGGMLELLEDIIGTSRFKTLFVQLYYCVEELSKLRTEKLKPVKGSCKKTTFLEFFLKLGEGSPNTQNLLLVNYSPKTPLKHLTITQDFSTCQKKSEKIGRNSQRGGMVRRFGKIPKNCLSFFTSPLSWWRLRRMSWKAQCRRRFVSSDRRMKRWRWCTSRGRGTTSTVRRTLRSPLNIGNLRRRERRKRQE